MRILANKEFPPSDKDIRKTNFIVNQYRHRVLPGVLEEMEELELGEPDFKVMERTSAS